MKQITDFEYAQAQVVLARLKMVKLFLDDGKIDDAQVQLAIATRDLDFILDAAS